MRFDVEGFVDDRIGIIGDSKSDSGHREVLAVCPFCNRPKFYVNTVTGGWCCFRCGAAGGAVKLVAEIDGVPMRVAREYVKRGRDHLKPAKTVGEIRDRDRMRGALPLGKRRRIGSTGVPDAVTDKDVESPGLPPEFIPVWDAKGRMWRVPAYLRERGIKARTAATYGIGFCKEGRYAGRLILPAHMDGDVRTFQGRAMGDWEPKYLTPTGDDKGSAIYGFDEAVGADHVIIAEGPLDVLALHQHGHPSVCLMGKLATPAQANAIRRAGFDRVTIMLDAEATREAAIVETFVGSLISDTWIAQLPDGKDPADSTRDEVETALIEARRPSLRHRLLGKD